MVEQANEQARPVTVPSDKCAMAEEVELTGASLPEALGQRSPENNDNEIRATKTPCGKRTSLISAGPVSCASLAFCAWSETTYPTSHFQCRSSVGLGVHGHTVGFHNFNLEFSI